MRISGTAGVFDHARLNISNPAPVSRLKRPLENIASRSELTKSLHHVFKLRESLRKLRASAIRSNPGSANAGPANAVSSSDLGLDPGSATTLRSTAEVNTIPTSISTFAPPWIGSTAQSVIGGTYDGSNGSGTLTFKVHEGGTHGVDDLKIKVFDPNDQEIEQLDISKNDPLSQQYTLSNGLTVTLGAGDLVKDDTFSLAVTDSPTSFSPAQPPWVGSTAPVELNGVYDGSLGTRTLTFEVINDGTHGVDDLRIDVFHPDGSFLETVNIDSADPVDTEYALSFGLSLKLDPGTLLKGTTFELEVREAAPSDLNGLQPPWEGLGTSTAGPTIDGLYLGTDGSGTLSFKVDRGGQHGVDDLRIKRYAADGSFVENIDIDKNDPIGMGYTLSNGLTLTLGAGVLVENDEFTLDVTIAPPSSFSGFQPNWQGLFSDAQVTLDGTYDGSNGTGTFDFVVTNGGTHGQDDLEIEVYAPDSSLLETVQIDKEDPINAQYLLANGIEITLGAGDLMEGDIFKVTFSETIGGAVNPDKPMNGTGADNPNLEPGFPVTNGSFEVNGVSITVNADDTINEVLDRITQSSAGVTATFDAATETVLLTQNGTGPSDIVFANDTSGFVAAMKLDGASSQLGTVADADRVMSTVAQFASVQSGTITVNEVDIAIDADADTLNDVLSRINTMVPDVVASLQNGSQRISILSNSSDPVVLDSGTTGLFAALQIPDGIYGAGSGGQEGTEVGLVSRSRTLTADLAKVAKSLNRLFDASQFLADAPAVVGALQFEIRQAVSEAFDDQGDRFKSRFGLDFNFAASAQEVFEFSESDAVKFRRKLRSASGAREVRELFFGNSESKPGLINGMLDSLDRAESNLRATLGSIGVFVDIRV